MGHILPSGFFNVSILTISSALALAASPFMMFIGSLVGTKLAPSADWATLPIAAIFIGTAAGILPATQLMKYMGRRKAFILFVLLGAFSCWLAGFSLTVQSFSIFCLSAVLLGVTNAALQQMRFAAMESVSRNMHATAASVLMCGGILAAFLGPEQAIIGRHLLAMEYQGSFWLVGGNFLVAATLLTFLKPTPQYELSRQHNSRPLKQIIKSPSFCLALVSATVSFAVMAFVMTGTPISMNHHAGYSLTDTKWVIQSHIAAMFIPSLITPWLFRWLSIKGVMLAGLACYCATVIIGMRDTSVMGYWYQLVLLGIGWNFLFIAGTALLPTTYFNGEQYKVQAFNDSTIFSIQALASLSAGWALNSTSWQTILFICLIPLLLLLFVLLWHQFRSSIGKPIDEH